MCFSVGVIAYHRSMTTFSNDRHRVLRQPVIRTADCSQRSMSSIE